MAKDIQLIIRGDSRNAEQALRELQRTGSNVADVLEREFDQLGTKSDAVFEAKRQSAQRAYDRIKASGTASASEIARAERGLADQLQSIDTDQYGKRLTMAEKFRANMGTIMAAAGVAYGAFNIGREAVQQAKEFETALTDLGKVGVRDLGAAKEAIMALPPEMGSATELMKGYYQTISAGVTEPKQAMDLLTTAARAAKAAHVEQGEAIEAITKMMAGYGGEIKTAAEAADLLFGIEKMGQTSVAQLVPVIGNLAAISKQAGLSQYEMGAALSATTQTAGSTEQAATQLRAILVSLLNPNKAMSEALAELGHESGRAAVEAMGFSGVLQGLAGTSTATDKGLAAMLGSVEALTGAAPLLSSEFATYNAAMTELQGNTGAADAAFKEWQGTLAATEEIWNNTVGKVMIELGNELAPIVNQTLRDMAAWINENRVEIVSFAEGLITLLTVLKDIGSAALTPFVQIGQAIGNTAGAVSILYENTAARVGNFFGGSSSGSAFADSKLFPPTPSYAVGTNYVPRTGLYQLHRGEQVVARGDAGKGQGGTVTIAPSINISMQGQSSDPERTARELARQIEPELRRLAARYR